MNPLLYLENFLVLFEILYRSLLLCCLRLKEKLSLIEMTLRKVLLLERLVRLIGVAHERQLNLARPEYFGNFEPWGERSLGFALLVLGF